MLQTYVKREIDMAPEDWEHLRKAIAHTQYTKDGFAMIEYQVEELPPPVVNQEVPSDDAPPPIEEMPAVMETVLPSVEETLPLLVQEEEQTASPAYLVEEALATEPVPVVEETHEVPAE